MLFKCDGRNRLAQGGADVAAWNEILWCGRQGAGGTLREEALWGREVRGCPATATAARARGGRQKKKKEKWEDFWVGGGQEAARFLHNHSLSLRPRSGQCFDGDLLGKCSDMQLQEGVRRLHITSSDVYVLMGVSSSGWCCKVHQRGLGPSMVFFSVVHI